MYLMMFRQTNYSTTVFQTNGTCPYCQLLSPTYQIVDVLIGTQGWTRVYFLAAPVRPPKLEELLQQILRLVHLQLAQEETAHSNRLPGL